MGARSGFSTSRLGQALEDYVIYHRGTSDTNLLFLNIGRLNGLPVNRKKVGRIIRQAFQKLNITGWWKGTHTIRRTAASKIYNSGNSLKLTADILGHSEIETTTTYTRIDVESLSYLAGQWPQGGATC